MEAESQAVLHTLREHNFQDAVKNGRSFGNGTYSRKGTTSRVMVASRSKVTVLPHGSTSHENSGWFFVWFKNNKNFHEPKQTSIMPKYYGYETAGG
jgi:hypothetical protein